MKKEVKMDIVVRQSYVTTKIVYLLVKWEEVITFLTVLCAISAIGFGVIWLFFREMVLLYTVMGLSSFYFVGKKFWKFRDEVT
jgi:hypothetical protein